MASTSSGVSTSRKRYISSRQVQKLSSPGSAPLGHAGHGALEGVAVQVRHRRQQRAAGEAQVAASGRARRLDARRCAPSAIVDAHVARPAVGQERAGGEERGHGVCSSLAARLRLMANMRRKAQGRPA